MIDLFSIKLKIRANQFFAIEKVFNEENLDKSIENYRYAANKVEEKFINIDGYYDFAFIAPKENSFVEGYFLDKENKIHEVIFKGNIWMETGRIL